MPDAGARTKCGRLKGRKKNTVWRSTGCPGRADSAVGEAVKKDAAAVWIAATMVLASTL